MGSRSNKKENTEIELRSHRKVTIKERIMDWYEEFKLNREGKTKRKRADIMARFRKVDQWLTVMIIIVGLLLLISWVIILFY